MSSNSDAGGRPSHCPRCSSPSPELHPALQSEGEVQPCSHEWHDAAFLPVGFVKNAAGFLVKADAGGRPARSALLDLVHKRWDGCSAAAYDTPRDVGMKLALEDIRALTAALEAAGLAAEPKAPARSVQQDLIATWRKDASAFGATGEFMDVAACQSLRRCANELEAAGLAAGDRPSLDDEVRCVNCGHGRKYHLQGRNSCFFFFGDSVCNCSEFQSEAAGDRPSLEPLDVWFRREGRLSRGN